MRGRVGLPAEPGSYEHTDYLVFTLQTQSNSKCNQTDSYGGLDELSPSRVYNVNRSCPVRHSIQVVHYHEASWVLERGGVLFHMIDFIDDFDERMARRTWRWGRGAFRVHKDL